MPDKLEFILLISLISMKAEEEKGRRQVERFSLLSKKKYDHGMHACQLDSYSE